MNISRKPKHLLNYKKYKKVRMKIIGDDICILCGLEGALLFKYQMSCYRIHGSRALRICNRCWWDDFIPLNIHNCPGCISDQNYPDIRMKHNYHQIKNKDYGKIIFNV